MADFAEHYQVRLHRRPRMTWAEFHDLVMGLTACDSRIWRATRPPAPDPEPQQPPDFQQMAY